LVLAVVALAGTGLVPARSSAATAAGSTFHVQPSVNQVAVTGAPRHAEARLLDSSGKAIARRVMDAAGSVLFRNVPTGSNDVVVIGGRRSAPVEVIGPETTPPHSFYSSQHLSPGFGYFKTRDGTLLSIDVTLPGPVADGPYPTVVEYSGYEPSNPKSPQPASGIARLLGFATVGVNLRGTGCSGGAWDYFETLQSLDGYDAIETVASQPWVAHGKVGMVGISYPGITQLFVAQTRPPHLAAITPLSVIDDTFATLYPGGIFNNGFALGWAKDRQSEAQPGGQKWAAQRIANGDTTCRKNQALRLQTPSVLERIRENQYLHGATSDTLASAAFVPATFVHNIAVPVFVAGSWQDEETGSHFAEMLGDFAPGVPLKVTLMNGIHADSIGPAVLSQWIEFLDFYVARKIPSISPPTRALASVLLSRLFGPGVELAPDRFSGETDYQTALAKYEAEPEVRLLFDVGAGGSPGAPVPGFATTEPSWPVPGTTATPYYFGPGGTLTPQSPSALTSGSGSSAGSGADQFRYDPAAFPATSAAPPSSSSERAAKAKGAADSSASLSNALQRLATSYRWKAVPAGKALAYVSAPLTENTVMAGTGAVDLWLQSSALDVDVEVTLSEVRPDGKETYVQSGWLRASQRKLDPSASTELLPVETHTHADASPLPKGNFSLVRVPLYPFAHAFRAGSRIRIVVQPPGGDRPAWAFDSLRYKTPTINTIARSVGHASRVVLPVVSGVSVPTPLPACGTLRGQPCRKYVPLTNAPAAPTSSLASGGSS
jgi:predicted acyl esterase